QVVRIVLALQLRRHVEREIVVHELPEISEARGDVRIVAALVLGPRLRLRLDHLFGQLAEQRVRWEERRQVAEHPSESALQNRGSEDDVQTARLDSMERLFRQRIHLWASVQGRGPRPIAVSRYMPVGL